MNYYLQCCGIVSLTTKYQLLEHTGEYDFILILYLVDMQYYNYNKDSRSVVRYFDSRMVFLLCESAGLNNSN